VLDALNAVVLRKFGNDHVWLYAPPSGFLDSGIDFYHTAEDCSDARLLFSSQGQGLIFYGQPHHGAVFYTTTTDPQGTIAVPIHAIEHFDAGQDATVPPSPATCQPFDGGTMSVGPVTTATDPALSTLVAPFRIK
jgi:hypothetical protein